MQSPGLTLTLALWAALAAAPASAATPAPAPVPASAPAAAATGAQDLPAAAQATAAPATSAAAAAHADSQLPDPTRPPASMLAPVTAAEEAPLAGGLQSILLPKPGSGGKPRAIIHGQTVELGGQVGDARLVHLTETTAVLLGPAGREVLRLLPPDMVQPLRKPGNRSRTSRRAPAPATPAGAPAP